MMSPVIAHEPPEDGPFSPCSYRETGNKPCFAWPELICTSAIRTPQWAVVVPVGGCQGPPLSALCPVHLEFKFQTPTGNQLPTPVWGWCLLLALDGSPNAGISVSNRRLIKYSNMQNHVTISNHQRTWSSRLDRWKFERRRGSIPGDSIFLCKGVSFCCCSLVSFSCCVLCCCAWWVVWLMWGVLGCG